MTVGLRERLFRLAETELRSAARRLRGATGSFRSRPATSDDLPPASPGHASSAETTAASSFPAKIQRYYANLELPVGAAADEVKAAYRRLMRRYHPDRHANDPKRAQVATQVAQELRTAYDGLMAYLADRSP
ncbi:MAG: J domain-containing protein [Myxococcota bacterium]